MSGFTSDLLPGELIIHDESPEDDWRTPDDMSTGLDLSARPNLEYGYGAAADPFPSQLLIDPSEWQARIEEMESTQSRISDLVNQSGLPCKDQKTTSLCWCFSPTHALEILRLQQNQPMISLSPASVGCRINGFENRGGWARDSIQFLSNKGAVPSSLWPDTAINRVYDTPANELAGNANEFSSWIECASRNMNQLISLLLRRIPVAVGYSWWSHEILACDPVWLDGAIAVRFRNSWSSSYGKNGFAVLQGAKAIPDDAVAPVSALAT